MSHKWDYDCTIKERARVFALHPYKQRPVAKVHLCMPAKECKCIKTALRMGIIDKQTRIIFVEQERLDFLVIKRKLKEMGFDDVCGFHGKLAKCDLLGIVGDKPAKLVDSAFIDVCGEYTNELGDWLYTNMGCFRKGAVISITTTANGRYWTRDRSLKQLKTFYNVEDGHLSKTKSLIPNIHKIGTYEGRTKQHTADLWALMLHFDLIEADPVQSNHYAQQLLYRSPGKKQNMAVTTIIK